LSKALTALAAIAVSLWIAGCDPALQREANRAPWEEFATSIGVQCALLSLYYVEFEDAGGSLPPEAVTEQVELYESFRANKNPPSPLPSAIAADISWLDEHVPTGLSSADEIAEVADKCFDVRNRIRAHTDVLYPPLFPSPT
jgi:hypothetical protein